MRRRFIVYGLWFMAITAFASSCAKKETAQAPKPSEEDAVDQKISTFTLTGYADGAKKKWQIDGKCADIFENVVKLDGVIAKAYGDDRDIVLTSDKGSVDKSTSNIHLEQNVVAKTSDGATLTTDYLDWQAKEEKATTDAKVTVERENMTAQGVGAIAQPQLRKARLKEDVVVNMHQGGANLTGATMITCAGPLDVDYGNSVATFNENVKAKDSRGELAADKMIVYFDQKSQKVVKVSAKGNVIITRGENVSTSDEAIYFANENKITLVGDPKVVIYPEKK